MPTDKHMGRVKGPESPKYPPGTKVLVPGGRGVVVGRRLVDVPDDANAQRPVYHQVECVEVALESGSTGLVPEDRLALDVGVVHAGGVTGLVPEDPPALADEGRD